MDKPTVLIEGNQAAISVTLPEPPLGVAAVALLYVGKDGKLRSAIRLGGAPMISRKDSLEALAQAISAAMERVVDEA